MTDRDTPSERHELHTRWVIMPWVNDAEMTTQAVKDCLEQTVPTRVLLIDQGASQAESDFVRAWIEQFETPEGPRVLLWTASPPMLSLGACWNRGLSFVWETGATQALVVNNDVRLRKETIEVLEHVTAEADAWFVSCVGVREGEFHTEGNLQECLENLRLADGEPVQRGGPDFSCFLLQQAGHFAYPFEESLIPAYCEDLDMHRRYLLGGHGPKIFGVNLPFLHYASGTIKHYTPEQREKFNRQYRGVLARYKQLWGGGPSEELWTRKGDPTSLVTDRDVTTPTLHRLDNERQAFERAVESKDDGEPHDEEAQSL